MAAPALTSASASGREEDPAYLKYLAERGEQEGSESDVPPGQPELMSDASMPDSPAEAMKVAAALEEESKGEETAEGTQKEEEVEEKSKEEEDAPSRETTKVDGEDEEKPVEKEGGEEVAAAVEDDPAGALTLACGECNWCGASFPVTAMVLVNKKSVTERALVKKTVKPIYKCSPCNVMNSTLGRVLSRNPSLRDSVAALAPDARAQLLKQHRHSVAKITAEGLAGFLTEHFRVETIQDRWAS